MAVTRRHEEATTTSENGGGVRGFASRYERYLVAGGILVTGLLVFGLLWFQPWKLVVEETANGARPSARAPASPGTTSVPAAPATIAAGSFRSLEPRTTGRAEIIKLA